MPSSWTQFYYHFVFGTKGRSPWITPELHDRLFAFIGGICKDLGGQLLAGNGMADHVHMLVRAPAERAPAELAREIKARSSRWIHETFSSLGEFAWQRGYGGFTVSQSALQSVEAYIRAQQVHHRTVTFEEEFVTFLKKHGIEFDPRYVME